MGTSPSRARLVERGYSRELRHRHGIRRLTLEGTFDWQFQEEAAARAVRDLTGVTGVTNSITVKPRVQPTAVGDTGHGREPHAFTSNSFRSCSSNDHRDLR